MEKEYGYIVIFHWLKECTASERVKYSRRVYGWIDYSQFSRYKYKREGILSNLPYIRLKRGVIIVNKESKEKIVSYLRGKADIFVRRIILTEEDKNKLRRRDGKI